MYLFMFYVGGNAGKSNIEVHDIQFVVARTRRRRGLRCARPGLAMRIKSILTAIAGSTGPMVMR